MSDYSEFFLNTQSNIVAYELLEISHPDFSRTYRMIRNDTISLTVTIDALPVVFRHYPMSILQLGADDNLDYGIAVEVIDVGNVFAYEFTRVNKTSLSEPVSVKYYVFRSDDLVNPIVGPYDLLATSVVIQPDSVSFKAKSIAANISSTGSRYSLRDFPVMKGLIT